MSSKSRVTIIAEGATVFTFTEDQVDTSSSEFPGNQADPQYAAKEAEIDLSKYGCAYTGRHDHGTLPAQTRGTPHEATLRFIEQARKVVGEELNTMAKAAKGSH